MSHQNMESQVQALLQQVQSADNARRSAAEQTLSELFVADPSSTAQVFISIAADAHKHQLVTRQSCLLYLKKVVPVFWSAGFQSFTGPAINTHVKQQIRDALLLLISSDHDSRIRNGAIYCVVQIAAVDFPDEWPGLLEHIYGSMLADNSSSVSLVGGLHLLQEIFDDLVTEELFFARGVGITTIQNCMKILDNENKSGAEVKALAANLYTSCLTQLQSPDVLDDPSKVETLKPHFKEITSLLQKLLSVEMGHTSHHDFELRTALYVISCTLIGEFQEDLIPDDFVSNVHALAINDLIRISKIYAEVSVLRSSSTSIQFDNDVSIHEVFNHLLTELYQLLITISTSSSDDLSGSRYLSESLEYFGSAILTTALIPHEKESEYLADFNNFVVDETGLSPDYTVRNAIFEYLTEANEFEFKQLKNWIWLKIAALSPTDSDWRSNEALYYLFKCIAGSEFEFVDSQVNDQSQVLEVLNMFITTLQTNSNLGDQVFLLKARIIDVIPEFLNSFKSIISISDFGVKVLQETLNYVKESSFSLLKVALLNTVVPYNTILDFKSIASNNLALSTGIYNDIFTIVTQLLEDAAEDTPSLLSESLTQAFKLHEHTIDDLNLLIAIVSKDPSDIQLIVEMEDALEALFDGISHFKFNQYLTDILPKLIHTIDSEGLQNNGEYSTSLNLSLQILSNFVSAIPNPSASDRYEPVSQEQFNLIFERISYLISLTADDQILQICGEIYNSLLVRIRHVEWFDLNVVLKVLSKFFSPDLSDSAVLNVGSLVVSILTRFNSSSTQAVSNEVLSEILEATSKRLLVTENISTIENFLNVLCFMVSINVKQTLIFLNNFGILDRVLNTWFKNFDILKGHERIKLNCESLIKIYLFIGEVETDGEDNSEILGIIKNLKVDGDELLNNFDKDVIVTRSMRKTMSFEQIPVFFKIIKLLITELNSQIVGNSGDAILEKDLDHFQEDEDEDHHDHDHDHDDCDGDDVVVDDEDEGWEDVEDIGDDFDKLKSYIDIDNKQGDKSDELKSLLIGFFKQVASQNILNFKEIYENYLNDQERQILTENIV